MVLFRTHLLSHHQMQFSFASPTVWWTVACDTCHYHAQMALSYHTALTLPSLQSYRILGRSRSRSVLPVYSHIGIVWGLPLHFRSALQLPGFPRLPTPLSKRKGMHHILPKNKLTTEAQYSSLPLPPSKNEAPWRTKAFLQKGVHLRVVSQRQ